MIQSENTNQEGKVFFDRGEISQDNQRLLNHVRLSTIAPDFIPAPLIPSDELATEARKTNSYPVEQVQGSTWGKLIYLPKESEKLGEEMQLDFSDHLQIALQTLKQVKSLLEEYGLVLADRHPNNTILSKVDQNEDFTHGNTKLKVWQVDLALVYDAVTGNKFIDKSIDLSQRKLSKTKNYADTQQTEKTLWKVVFQVLAPIYDVARSKRSSLTPDAQAELHKFSKTFEKYDPAKEQNGMNLDEAINFIEKLVAAQNKSKDHWSWAKLLRGRHGK